jgi:cytoskeleton protein RodZ
VLDVAETKELEGHNSARIRTGNAGGVNVLFNGKTIGSLGPRGQVRTVVFTKDNYEIVEPSADIALMSFSPSGE